MGIGLSDFGKLLSHKSKFKKLDSICDIGASQIYCKNEHECLLSYAKEFYIPGSKRHPTNAEIENLANLGYAKHFWMALNYKYLSIDTSGESGSLYLDLNFDNAPFWQKHRYQLILNCGTTEHIANQIQAFKVIHDLCAPEGFMYHHLPFQGYQTHGLVNYTAKFFWMLCRSNNYNLTEMEIQSNKDFQSIHTDILETYKELKKEFTGEAPIARESGIIVLLQMPKKKKWFIPPFDGHVLGELNGIPKKYRRKYKPLLWRLLKK